VLIARHPSSCRHVCRAPKRTLAFVHVSFRVGVSLSSRVKLGNLGKKRSRATSDRKAGTVCASDAAGLVDVKNILLIGINSMTIPAS
jgi:hypothetical protein